MGNKRLIVFLLCLAMPLLARSQDYLPHQVRLGWGDMLFETMAYHPGAAADGRRMHNFGYTGHIFAEYRYRFTPLVGFGVQADYEGIFWKETLCDGYWKPVGDTVPVRNSNICLIPTLQLNYFNKEWVELYFGSGIGALISFDNARHVEAAPAVDMTLLGIWMGKGHWGGALELGGLSAILSTDKIYMLGSRLISVSFNYRW